MAAPAPTMPPDAKGGPRAAPGDFAALQTGALPAALLFVAFALLYGATRTHYNTFDAVSYADQIGRLYPATHDRRWLFHPHHLLFNVSNYALWRGARALGYTGGPLVVMERLNGLLAALGVSLFFLTLRGLMRRSWGLPVLAAAGLGLSFGPWVCATDGRVNMPSLVCLLAAFGLLCRALEAPPGAAARRFAAVGALAGLAVLFHESAALFVLVGLAGAALAPNLEDRPPAPNSGGGGRSSGSPVLGRGGFSGRHRLVLAYGAAWLGTVVVPYALFATLGLHLHSWPEFRRWTTEYAGLGWWWSFDIPHNLRLDISAFRHAVIADLPGRPGTFSLARRVPLDLRVLYFGALAGWLLAVYAFFAALPLLWRSHHRPVLIVCLLWIALYAAFFTVWCAGYFVFWVPVLVPTGLLLVLGIGHTRSHRGGRWVNGLFGLWVLLFAVVNWHGSIGPHRAAGASPFERVAADVKAHTRPGDEVLLAGAGDLGPCEVFLPYFAGRDVVSLHALLTRARNDRAAAYAAARAQVGAVWASGHAVYALDELWHGPQAWNGLRRRHPGVGPADLSGWAVRAPRPAWTDKHGRPVWRLVPPTAGGPA